MNHTRKGYGVGSLRDGKEFYKACLKWHLSIDMSPEDIHQLGLQEVKRISKLMQKVIISRLKIIGHMYLNPLPDNKFWTLPN